MVKEGFYQDFVMSKPLTMFFSSSLSLDYYPKHLLFHTLTYHPKPLHFNPILKISHKPILVITCYNKPPISHNYPSLKKIPQKLVILFLGSFIFVGGFRTKKPVLAQTQKLERVDMDDEEMMYTKLLEGDSKNVEALKAIFHGKMKKGKTKEAIEYIDKLIAIEPNQVEWRLLQALCYELIGDISKAKSVFKNVLKERPLLLRALHGIIYSLLDKKEEAEEQFLTYESLLPDEFPQREFLDDVVLAAKTEIRQKRQEYGETRVFNEKIGTRLCC